MGVGGHFQLCCYQSLKLSSIFGHISNQIDQILFFFFKLDSQKSKNLKSAPPANQRRSLAVKYNSGCDET